MLTEYTKFRLMDKAKKNDFYCEVNWEPESKDINNSKILKFVFPNNEVAFIEKKHLLEILFAIGAPSEQRKMIPQKISKVRWYETVLSVKALKDIRKGENIAFPIKLTLPAIEEEVIQEIKREYRIPKGIILPKKVES